MAGGWQTVTADQVQSGDRVRMRGFEFEVARVDQRFMGREGMLCMIEDTPERWHAYPCSDSMEVEVQR